MSLFLILLIVWWQFKYFFYGIESGVNLYDIQAIEFYKIFIYLLQFWIKLLVCEPTKSQVRKSKWVLFFRISTWADSWLWWAEDRRWPPWPCTHPGYLGYWGGLPLCHHSRIPLCQRGYGQHAGTIWAIFYSCVSLIGRCTFLIILRTSSQVHVFPGTDSSEDAEADGDLGTEGPTECDCDPGKPGFAGFAGPKVPSHLRGELLKLQSLAGFPELGRGARVYQRNTPPGRFTSRGEKLIRSPCFKPKESELCVALILFYMKSLVCVDIFLLSGFQRCAGYKWGARSSRQTSEGVRNLSENPINGIIKLPLSYTMIYVFIVCQGYKGIKGVRGRGGDTGPLVRVWGSNNK